jgi:membrane-associated phospholipid phosphatase
MGDIQSAGEIDRVQLNRLQIISEPSRERSIESAPVLFDDSEVAAAWRVIGFNWRLIACAVGVLNAGLVTTEFHIQPTGYLIAFAVAALYWRFGRLNTQSAATRRNLGVSFSLTATAQMIIVLAVMTSLTYVLTSINLPLMDTSLLAWDRALGLDFRKYLNFVIDHPRFLSALAFGYTSITWQILGIIVVLPLAGHYRRTGEAICAFALALMVTTCISVLVPAIGVYGTLGLVVSDFPNFEPQGYYDTLRDVPLLRAGSLHALSLSQLVGVLTFPSFHAASALLYIWAFWPVRWLSLFLVPCNVVMIASTPIGGGHYFVDVIAGMAVAVAAIIAARSISRMVARACLPECDDPLVTLAPRV